MKEITPHLILGHGQFFQRTLLTSSSFVDYCKKRGIDISEDRLEKFEKLGIFYPILRIKRPKIKSIKISGEVWHEYAAFLFFNNEYREYWINKKRVFIPNKRRFKPWTKYKDENCHNKVSTYYSIFQTLPLYMTVKDLERKLKIEDFASMSEEESINLHKSFSLQLERAMRLSEKGQDFWNKDAFLCQIISSRYLPSAESNDVTISLPRPTNDFNFFEFRRNWNSNERLEELELTTEEVKRTWERITSQIDWINPISAWDELIHFIKKDKKEQLKGSALLVETWKVMANMLSEFHEDLTGKPLNSWHKSTEGIESLRGKGISKDDLRYMEFIANEFGVNPRPKLILIVEGKGEFIEIPKLFQWLNGISLAKVKVQLLNLNSVSEFTPKKFERFVDHFHNLQTIVYFVLDNENKSSKHKDQLINTNSRYIQNLPVTKDDLFTIWNKNIEFDNFSDEEISEAMTKLCENRYKFTKDEINEIRQNFIKEKRDVLSVLYESKLNYGLNKPKLLGILFEKIKLNFNVKIEGKEMKRPILEVIEKITRLSLRNFQPTRLQDWSETQNSGWLREIYTPNTKNGS